MFTTVEQRPKGKVGIKYIGQPPPQHPAIRSNIQTASIVDPDFHQEK